LAYQISLDDAKRELDLREVETESLRADLRASKQRTEAMREIQSRLEMESAQMVDELDVGRDKGLRLIKAETQIVKYQQRLEEMNGLKKLNKELSEKNDQYMDQIHELESSNRGIDTLRKQVDEYKVKNLKLETEKFEAISASQVKDHEMDRLAAELASLSQAKRLLEDELQSAREESAAAAEEAKEAKNQPISGSRGLEGGLYEVETVTSLREKLKRVERELVHFKDNTADHSQSTGSTAQLATLQSELEDANKAKREREEALLVAKKQLSDTQSELHKVNRAHEVLQQQSSSGESKEQGRVVKEQEKKLLQTENTVRLLEESLKEKEVLLHSINMSCLQISLSTPYSPTTASLSLLYRP
jgi:HOOK protein coiled-coil region